MSFGNRMAFAVYFLILCLATIGVGQITTRTFRWPEGKRAAISLSFDDARPSQIDTGLPFFALHDAKVTFYVSPGRMKERYEGWKKAAAAGHEIGNHSMSHPCSANFEWSRKNALEDMGLDEMRRELSDANRAIREQLGIDAKTFAYPCGQKYVGRGRDLKSYIPMVAGMFAAGRGYLDESPNDPLFCDMAQLMAVSGDNLSFERIRPLVDQAVEKGQWLILAGHEIGTGDKAQTTQVAMLEELFRYAGDPARGLWIDTILNIGTYVEKQRGGVSATKAPQPGTAASFHKRAEDLLGRMTLEEKVGQINMPCVYVRPLGKNPAEKIEACRKFAEGTFEPGIGPGGGFFTLANTVLPDGSRQQAEFFNALQKIAVEKTRLGIPLLQTEEGTHGVMCSGKTIFPEGLALGSTWNPELLERIYAAAAREARSVGIHQLFTLVVEPNRDPRLGRNEEGYGEDPYLCARIAEAIVKGTQGTGVGADDRVVAGLCHYPGQGQPASGMERGAMEISERSLREVFLPPWIAGIRKNGALGVMATYPAIDDVPVHASAKILTEILRGELNFDGLVLSEGSGISTLQYEGLAASSKEAGELALKAGVDVGISYERAYMSDLIESVKEGRTPMALIDRAVRRILLQKLRLGLFENPYVDADRAAAVSRAPSHVALALTAGREGIVLLKNEKDLLPLSRGIKSIAVIGPNADNARNQLGDYTPNSILQKVVTVLDGVRTKLAPGTAVVHVKGCEVTGSALDEIAKARAAAAGAEIAIVVLGESHETGPGSKLTDGEAYDVASLDLSGLQEELAKAVVETGTPTVIVLINGRPLSTRWIAEHASAIVEAWLPGEQGGDAVADVLFGDCNPSGRLPITIPRHVGQYPFYYNYKPSKDYWINQGWAKPYVDMSPEPLYEFGFGLSYTRFEYSNLRIDPPRIGADSMVSISADVRNSGKRKGNEVVQLYLRDMVGSVATPVKQLRGFEKISLEPGETKTVHFNLGREHLALLDNNMTWTVEPGEFEIMIGSSSKAIQLRGKFAVAR